MPVELVLWFLVSFYGTVAIIMMLDMIFRKHTVKLVPMPYVLTMYYEDRKSLLTTMEVSGIINETQRRILNEYSTPGQGDKDQF